jgi:hypothetical protein
MLDSLDVLIGFSFVMLTLSTAVTVLTQMASNLLNLRGQTLRAGIGTLLRQVDPQLAEDVAGKIADAVLRHPLVAGPGSWLGAFAGFLPGGGLGNVISREELLQVLLSIADPNAEAGSAGKALSEALQRAGITNPSATLGEIQKEAMKLEQAHPAWAENVRISAATVKLAANQFTASLNAWFDNGMERVRDVFVGHVRWVTVACALAVTVVVPIDSVRLLRCLWVEPELRQALSKSGQAAADAGQPDAETLVSAMARIQQLEDDLAKLRPSEGRSGTANSAAEAPPAATPGRGTHDCTPASLFEPARPFDGRRLPGVVLTWILLSLGAPFWYDALKNLVKLRPTLAGREESQRAKRSSGTAPPEAGPTEG